MFSLARELGMTVAELGHRMSAREMVEWGVFFEVLNSKDQSSDQLEQTILKAYGAKRG